MNLSQRKGKTYEREIAAKLSKFFNEEIRRTPAQEKWKSRGGDINPRNPKSILSRFFIETKKREAWNILDWYKKAKDDSEIYRTPVVVCSKNQEEDYVFFRLDDFLKILLELDGYQKQKDEIQILPNPQKENS